MNYKKRIKRIDKKLSETQESLLNRITDIEVKLPVNLKNDIQNHYNHLIIVDKEISLLKKLCRETKVEDIQKGMEKIIEEIDGRSAAPKLQMELYEEVYNKINELFTKYDIGSFEFEDYHDNPVVNVLPTLFIKFKDKQ